MKFSTTFRLGTFLMSACVFFYFVSCNQDKPSTDADTETVGESYADVATGSTACECEASWFPHTQTPPPAEGTGSPFDTSSTTNCMFHQWSWQKFLWLTKPQANGLPLFQNELYLVDAKMAVVAPQQGEKLVLSSIKQAGGGGILQTNPAFASNGSAATVYYSIHVDSTMFSASESFKEAINGGSLPANNSETFPIGSLELKVAWVDADAIAASEVANYYTTSAAIEVDGAYVTKTVALLGMHVVGVVINHPEFIWATFEHHSMAPTYNWATNEASASNDMLLFAAGTTNTLAGIQWDGSTPKEASKAYTLFELGVPRVSGNGFMATSQKEPENFNNINTIDSCVAANLSDVWNNYFYKGSLWLNTDGLSPQQQADTIVAMGYGIATVTPNAMPRGCTANANLTMETFEQTFAKTIGDISVNNLSNCFSCHSAVGFASGSPKSPLYLSHVFDGYLQSSQGTTMEQINKLKFEQHSEIRSRLESQ